MYLACKQVIYVQLLLISCEIVRQAIRQWSLVTYDYRNQWTVIVTAVIKSLMSVHLYIFGYVENSLSLER